MTSNLILSASSKQQNRISVENNQLKTESVVCK